jgi:predicted signal transduction protein with EAL and GGDEF domain
MLETSLRRALERDEFVLHYQAKQDLATGEISGVEALLRWQHPDLGVLPPIQFISLAEESGLIVPIGRWVLDTACAQNMAWQEQGLPPMRIAVNLSPRQFTDPNLLENIRDALANSGMMPQLLDLEITESMMMQNADGAMRVLTALKKLGVHLAIDDFGTGKGKTVVRFHSLLGALPCRLDLSEGANVGARKPSYHTITPLLGRAIHSRPDSPQAGLQSHIGASFGTISLPLHSHKPARWMIKLATDRRRRSMPGSEYMG